MISLQASHQLLIHPQRYLQVHRKVDIRVEVVFLARVRVPVPDVRALVQAVVAKIFPLSKVL
jgi:hypothetical protein